MKTYQVTMYINMTPLISVPIIAQTPCDAMDIAKNLHGAQYVKCDQITACENDTTLESFKKERHLRTYEVSLYYRGHKLDTSKVGASNLNNAIQRIITLYHLSSFVCDEIRFKEID